MNEESSSLLKEQAVADRAAFGFWIYLLTDLIVFTVLFAAYAVLRGNTFGGPTAQELFSLPSALAETLILLTSSFACGLAMIAVRAGRRGWATVGFGVTFALGATFLVLELGEFGRMVAEGAGWQRSGFLSSFFALVGTHGLHIAVGLLWIAIAMFHIWLRGLSPRTVSKLERFALFWHFLDVVWIFIFTIVYLMAHV